MAMMRSFNLKNEKAAHLRIYSSDVIYIGDINQMGDLDDRQSKQYGADEVSRILKRALNSRKEEAINYQELTEIAREMGIDTDSLDAAIARDKGEIDMEEARKEWLRRRRSDFNPHLWSFIIIIGGLFLIDLITPGGWWFQWPMLGWGIGLAFHFRASYFPRERRIERGARKILSRRKARR